MSFAGACAPLHERTEEAPPPGPPAPVPTTAALALERTGPTYPERPIRLVIGGDLLPHRPSLVSASAIRDALAPLASTFASADAAIANYEAATGTLDAKAARLEYAAPPGWLEELPQAGLEAITVANNHACDLGEEGLDATLDAASKSGLLPLGGDRTDPWAPRVVAEHAGKRVCAIAWTNLLNSRGGACAKGRRLAIAPTSALGRRRIDEAFSRARGTCDATVAIFHGGEEYVQQTSAVLDQAAHAAEVGAAAVVIHHPHIASPVIVHVTKDGRSVPIFSSVGNLVTNQGESWKPSMFPVLRENRRLVCVNGWTRLGVLADLSFGWDAEGARLSWGYHLVWIDNPHADDRTIAVPKITTRLLDPVEDKAIVGRLSDDPVGPVALFQDACWIEGSGSDGDKAVRCRTSLTGTDVPKNRDAVAPRAARTPGRRKKGPI